MLALQERIRPSADLRNHYNEISKQCREDKEAVIITVNGRGDTVSLGYEEYNRMKGNNSMKVCLDAGHYGKYNRSRVVEGYYESEMNWKLQGFLAQELGAYGIDVITTRSEPAKDLGLVARGKKSAGCAKKLSVIPAVVVECLWTSMISIPWRTHISNLSFGILMQTRLSEDTDIYLETI